MQFEIKEIERNSTNNNQKHTSYYIICSDSDLSICMVLRNSTKQNAQNVLNFLNEKIDYMFITK
jgi:hypothetical protein